MSIEKQVERWIISPGIVKQVGKDPSYIASIMFGPTFDQYVYDDIMPDEKRRYKVYDLMRQTGWSKQTVKWNLRKLMKHHVVTNIIEGYYSLTWDARLHIQYVAEMIIDLSNDALYDTAQKYQMYEQYEKERMETEAAQSNNGDNAGSVEGDAAGVAQDDSGNRKGDGGGRVTGLGQERILVQGS